MDSATILQWTNEAFKQCYSVLALSRSPLAATPLVVPALVVDELSPTADERGRALRVVLHWAVAQLAPGPVAHPPGTFRPWDDPTWREPHWWRYNILRHRYLEPLHPDDFVEGGRYMETLLALTGIPSVDTLYDERSRALRAVADILRQQMTTRAADAELQRMAVQELLAPLSGQTAAHSLLSLAAIFEGVFPRALLLQMAADEGIGDAMATLERLTHGRYLLTGDEGANLWLAVPLRSWLAQQDSQTRSATRHRTAARYYRIANDPLAAVWHLQAAGQWPEAAELLLRNLTAADEGKSSTLRNLLAAFPAGRLSPDQWRIVQLHLADLEAAFGSNDAAIAACRTALKASHTPSDQARCYRRLGKLYEKRNPMHALNYYHNAETRFAAGDSELIVLHKDRGWLHILHGNWAEAAADLKRALALVPAEQPHVRADVLDALASLHRNQGKLADAIDYAQESLALREERGDLLSIAKSLGNLGLLYASTGDFAHAIAAHREAMDVYARMGNQELVAAAWLNIGMTEHLAGDHAAAIDAYRSCLHICRETSVPLTEVKALHNLAEALAEAGDPDSAQSCWMRGNELAHLYAFEDQVHHFETLAREQPALASLSAPATKPSPAPIHGRIDAGAADPTAHRALEMARLAGQVTPRALMEAAAISKATATRQLSDLAAHGLLVKFGHGRGTTYRLPNAAEPSPAPAIAPQVARLEKELSGRYQLSELRIVDEDHWRGGVQLIARFRQPPDLKHFFELEGHLANALGLPVDLVPGDP